jgi:hypothetical protein
MELLAALIGAVVGGIFALAGGIIPFWWSICREKEKQEQIIRGWRKGLSAELGHSFILLEEAEREIAAHHGYLGRINSDFLEATRFKWGEYDSDEKFLATLPRAYRDLTLTNKHLDGLEEMNREVIATQRGFAEYGTSCDSVLIPIKETKNSVTNLKKIVDEKIAKDIRRAV